MSSGFKGWRQPAVACAFLCLLALPLPRAVRRGFAQRRGNALHTAAGMELNAGRAREAWRWHLRSLAATGGWRYSLYTRRLLYAAFRSATN